MKTIFRYANIGLLTAVIFALGAVAGFAQDPCADADTLETTSVKVRKDFADYAKAILADRQKTVEGGKQFLEKYGACEAAKDLVDYLKRYLPGMETKLSADKKNAEKQALYTRFDASVKASNFADTYASGKEILVAEPEQWDVIITLGSIGYDESYKGNFKFNDDTVRFAKQAIAALESGKTPKTYGLFGWSFKTKDKALAELNLTIGYIMQVAQKNKKDAAPYLFKATQGSSDTTKNPIPYELIGYYYFDELDKLTTEIKAMAADQKDTDTPEVAKQKVDAIKAKVALSNGTAERAMDAFSRAYTLSASTPAAKPYKDKMKKNVEDAYNLRFAKKEGVDAWITTAAAKQFINPMTPVTPISDPEPVAPATTTTTSTTPPATTKPATPIKPAATPGVKPATPPGKSGAKPQAVVKKATVRKKAA